MKKNYKQAKIEIIYRWEQMDVLTASPGSEAEDGFGDNWWEGQN